MAPDPNPAVLDGVQQPETLSGEQLLRWRRRLLADGGEASSQAPELDWLLDLAGGVAWRELQELRLHPQRPVRLSRCLADLESLWQRHRRSGEPLQYLVGLCPWRDLTLQVGPGVLIPRQDTELLIDLALELAPLPRSGQSLYWADLGTGSGCLALALWRALPGSSGLAVDLSAEALAQARANLAAMDNLPAAGAMGQPPAMGTAPDLTTDSSMNPGTGLATDPSADTATDPGWSPAPPLRFRQGHWWQAIAPWWGQLDLVVSNPPYIPSATLGQLDPVVRDHEPWLALDGGPDGLEAIRTIIRGAPLGLAPGGVLLLEHHHDHSDAVLQLLAAAGLEAGCAHRDLEGVRRFASARRPITA